MVQMTQAPEVREAPAALRGHVERATHDMVDEMRSTAEERLHLLVTRLRDASHEFEAVARGDTTGAPQMTRLARDAGDTIGLLADRWERRGVDGLAEDVRSFARRRPGRFLAVCAVAGFAAGRMGRASMRRRSQDGAGSGSVGTPGMAGGTAGRSVTPPMSERTISSPDPAGMAVPPTSSGPVVTSPVTQDPLVNADAGRRDV